MKEHRAASALGLMTLVIVALAASAAWACTPTANVAPLGPSSGPPGTQIVVQGREFHADKPVTIHWNDLNGRVLGQAKGPEFSVTVTVPDAPPEFYPVFAVQRDETGAIIGQNMAVFDLTEATVPDDGGGSGGATSGEPTDNPPPGSGPGPSPSGADTTAAGTGTSSSAGDSATASPPPRGPRGGTRGSAAAPAAVQPSTGEATSPPAPATPGAQAQVPVVPPVDLAPTYPSLLTSADLWAGFDSGSTTRRGPSLNTASDSRQPGHNGIGVGLGLLTVGLATLLGAVTAAQLSRRRTTSASRSAATQGGTK